LYINIIRGYPMNARPDKKIDAPTTATQGKTGERRGAKALYGRPMRRVVLMLDDSNIEFLTELGGNNLSQGARRASEILKENTGWKGGDDAEATQRKAA
jgi:hypothetical protein